MIDQETLRKLREMKLGGMAEGFEEVVGTLVDREWSERENRRLSRLLKAARIVPGASLEDVRCSPGRGLDKAVLRDLATCRWVREKLNVIVVGKTGQNFATTSRPFGRVRSSLCACPFIQSRAWARAPRNTQLHRQSEQHHHRVRHSQVCISLDTSNTTAVDPRPHGHSQLSPRECGYREIRLPMPKSSPANVVDCKAASRQAASAGATAVMVRGPTTLRSMSEYSRTIGGRLTASCLRRQRLDSLSSDRGTFGRSGDGVAFDEEVEVTLGGGLGGWGASGGSLGVSLGGRVGVPARESSIGLAGCATSPGSSSALAGGVEVAMDDAT